MTAVETRQEFQSRIEAEFPDVEFGKTHVALPCTCADGGGGIHWAKIPRTTAAIYAHVQLEQCLCDLRFMAAVEP